ncbi:MAG: hypothetical protein DSY90_01360 [Deltaproteobacteria bacterium]|nr:MAG: hypothetical protein DSY90_01360 [Deltaproteobacteria bacterium]
MYFPYFISYMAIGFTLSLVVLIWAIRTGQFKHQRRARFLPLTEELNLSTAKTSRFNRLETYALFFIAIAGLGASAAVLISALLHGN